MKIIYFLLLYVFSFSLFSQKCDYKPLMSKGEIPEEFLISSVDKYNKAKDELKGLNLKGEESEIRSEFLLKSNYNIDQILRSGNVVFGDKVTKYINDIVDILLQNDKELRKELRIYTLKSSNVNAFSTNQGIVFVNLGLIAQVENEAQLAFVLAHEIIHYKNKHVIDRYIKTKEISKGKANYKQYTYDKSLEFFYNYSKGNEIEADVEGLKNYYLKTKYSPKEVEKILDVLLYSYLPFDEVEFEKAFLENENFKLSDTYLLDNVKAISAVDDYDDTKKTHPNIKTRKEEINELLAGLKKEGNKYLLGKDRFKEIQKIARFEICRIQAEERNYGLAFYNTYVMLKKYPESKFLKKNMAYILYGLSKFKNIGQISSVLKSYKRQEGSSQQVLYFFRKITKKELNVVAINYVWNLFNQYPNDKDIEALAKDLIKDLITYHNVRYSYFETQKPNTIIEFKELTKEEYNKLTKSEKINYKKKRNKYKRSNDIAKYAFVDFVNEEKFKKLYTKMYDYVMLKQQKDDFEKSYREIEKERKRKELYGRRLGIDKIVIVNPIHSEFDYRKSDPNKYISSEKMQEDIIDIYSGISRKLNMNNEYIVVKKLKQDDIDKFNDYVKFNKWFSELLNTFDIEDLIAQDTSLTFELMNKENAIELCGKYKTKYFAWVETRLSRTRKERIGSVLLYSAIYFPLLPFGIYYSITPKYTTEYYFLLLNLEKNEVRFFDYKAYPSKINKTLMNSIIYDNLNQIKHN